jgi:hypothetical protein
MSLAKMLGGFAIATSCCVAGAAPAPADPDAHGAEPNPYGTLRCGCPDAAGPDSAERRNEINRGIRQGLSAWVPGLPPPSP